MNVFQEVIQTGLDILMALSQIHTIPAGAPWMSQKLKSLILEEARNFL